MLKIFYPLKYKYADKSFPKFIAYLILQNVTDLSSFHHIKPVIKYYTIGFVVALSKQLPENGCYLSY